MIPVTRTASRPEALFRILSRPRLATRQLLQRRRPAFLRSQPSPPTSNRIQSVSHTAVLSTRTFTSQNTPPPPPPSTPTQPEQNLKALIGKPCPGCGSPFQIDHPNDPGYLARIGSTSTFADDKNGSKKGKADKPSKNVDRNAKTMDHSQYEEYIKTLDPKLLQEMGILPPDTPELNSAETQDPLDPEQTPEVLDRKPSISSTGTAGSSRVVCHRCHSLSHHASPIAQTSILPSVHFPSPPAPVPKHLETLAQSKSATVVLVVDLIDFPLSLPQVVKDELMKVKQHRKNPSSSLSSYPAAPIILVGNKFDAMPLGTRKGKVIQHLQQYLERHGLAESVRAIHLVSAKNPVGDEIRLLLKSIGKSWSKSGKGNVVMVGAENVGKSQLLNAFLKESGRWRPNDQQAFQRKHGQEQQERQEKLERLLGSSNSDSSDTSENASKDWAEMTGLHSVGAELDQYEELYKKRGMEKMSMYKTTVSNVPGTTLERIKVPLHVLSRFFGASYKEVQTKWLMDTPGIRAGGGQITSLLTLDELKVTLPKKMLKPTSFVLEEGKSFFLGGLVRIDCISIGKPAAQPSSGQDSSTDSDRSNTQRPRGSNPAPKLTCFTTLPLHKTSITGADKFLEKTRDGHLTVLQPPFGSAERLAAFPGLAPISKKDLVIVNDPIRQAESRTTRSVMAPGTPDPFAKLGGDDDGPDNSHSHNDPLAHLPRQERENIELQLMGHYGVCDVVFAGIGWVMISGKFQGPEQAVQLRVWTPQGQGATVRDVCLLPELAANLVEKTSGGIRQRQKLFQPLPRAAHD
ncbi:nitric oxide associated protein 1 [Podila epigama]|nr:nitric oxide associated protein 1 [Podila epigama]